MMKAGNIVISRLVVSRKLCSRFYPLLGGAGVGSIFNFAIRFLIIALLGVISPLQAQEDSTITEEQEIPKEKIRFLEMTGYLKELGNLSFDKSFKIFQYDNIIHNRMNATFNFSKNFHLKTGLRNRLFNGYTVNNFDGYADILEQDLGWADMSWAWLKSKSTIAHSTIDRLYFTFSRKKWELNVGRQRINWGKSTVWNPNDLFNTYSYLDFDYEERRGADAVRFQYYTGYASGFEIAIAPGENWDETVAAFMLKANKWNYDFQFLAGNYREELALGLGWAGDIAGIGFKGEMTYFHPRHHFKENSGFVNATLSFDYAVPNTTLYLQTEFLYNGNWKGGINPTVLFTQPLPANNLFIGKEAFFVGGNIQLHPLITANLGGIASFSENLYILVPGLTFSVAENLDFLITAQLLRNKILEQFSPVNNLVFWRLKWSF